MSEATKYPSAGWKARLASLRRGKFWRRLDGWLGTWGPLVLLVFAVCYYGQYYRSGLNLGGEGGTAAVNAMRLNDGWLPIKETILNYNVLWFYPVAWLFKVTGPDYIALRLYFFAICLLMGVFGFLIVRRVTNGGWLALGVGLLILAIPGMLFRNYMGLLAVLNAWVLLHAFVFEPARTGAKWLWFGGAGLVMGATYLVRIDVGIFFTAIYLGLVVTYPLGIRGGFLRRCPVAMAGGLIGVMVALGIQALFYFDAQRRGFGPEFAGQYPRIWNQIRYQFERKSDVPRDSAKPSNSAVVTDTGWIPVHFKKASKNWSQLAKAERAKRDEANRHGRPRPELRDLFKQRSFYDAAFILVLYMPVLFSGLVVAVAGVALAWAIFVRDAALKEACLVSLVTLGAALTLFPQYFFFRPDTPHLSEFMVPFLVALACAGYYASCLAKRSRSWLIRAVGIVFVAYCLGSEGLYFFHAFPKESAGTIAAARKRAYEVAAENGVRVLVKRREQPWLQALHDTIVHYADPGEWVIAFPYSPTINFMTNRPSYLKDLYIDNATAGRNFFADTVAQINLHRPAVIVIDQRNINDTEVSRFKNWAAPTYDYIRSHYMRVPGKFDTNEIYVRPDKISPQT